MACPNKTEFHGHLWKAHMRRLLLVRMELQTTWKHIKGVGREKEWEMNTSWANIYQMPFIFSSHGFSNHNNTKWIVHQSIDDTFFLINIIEYKKCIVGASRYYSCTLLLQARSDWVVLNVQLKDEFLFHDNTGFTSEPEKKTRIWKSFTHTDADTGTQEKKWKQWKHVWNNDNICWMIE